MKPNESTERPSAWTLAARVLVRVFEDRAFAAAVLDTELARSTGLDRRDAALATELVYGVLRTEGALEAALVRHSRTGTLPDNAPARAHLLSAAYALSFLDRVPDYAAVNEAVRGVSQAIGDKPARFANAVLRAYATELEHKGRPSLEEAIAEGAAGWLRGALRRSIGRGGARAFLAAGPVPPPLGLAVADPSARAGELEALAASMPHAKFEVGRFSPHAILAQHAGDPRKLDGFENRWIVQEEGAQLVALALGSSPGERVLDACAGRGNKSWLLARQVGPGGAVVSVDKHPSKLEAASARAIDEAGASHATFATDWLVGAGDVPRDFDAVLVDAPCSGTGTLRRRPEIGRHRTASDLVELASAQIAIVRRAASCARPNARLVYAVCSVLREEAEDVVAALAEPFESITLEPAPFVVRGPLASSPARELLEGKTSVRLTPHEHGTDGYFLASFVVRHAAALHVVGSSTD